jgi:hypothetical protein
VVKKPERRTIRLVMEVVGETLIKERNTMRAEAQGRARARRSALRSEFLTIQLADERAKRHKAAPSSSMIA